MKRHFVLVYRLIQRHANVIVYSMRFTEGLCQADIIRIFIYSSVFLVKEHTQRRQGLET